MSERGESMEKKGEIKRSMTFELFGQVPRKEDLREALRESIKGGEA